MKLRSRRFVRRVLIALPLVLLAAWLIPPFISAEHFRHRLEPGLRQALKRPVTFGAVSFRLLWRPGFTLENAVVHEDPAFGSEPFARVEKIDCDLRWSSLWRSRIEFGHLYLDHATFNAVRNARGEWNVATFLRQSGVASSMGQSRRSGAVPARNGLDLEVEDARINFKVGEDKKPFAITDLKGQLNFDPTRGLVRYRLTGSPVRTDLSLPTPGPLELAGEWTPGRDLEGPLDATLRAQKSLLYDWIPLLAGRNPEIYGVLDGSAHITGSLATLEIEGESEVTQLHRWDLPPPSSSTPVKVDYRGEIDRRLGRARIEELRGSFAGAHLQLSGSIEQISTSRQLNLALAFDQSSLEDLLALGGHFWRAPQPFGISGRLDGLLAVEGPQGERHYGGLLTAREVRVNAPQGKFPVSQATLRIDSRGIQLAPARLMLAPHAEVLVEGAVYPAVATRAKFSRSAARARVAQRSHHSGPKPTEALPATDHLFPRYELSLSTKSIPLADLARLVRTPGRLGLRRIEVGRGVASGTLRLTGRAWPPEKPRVDGRLEVQAARLLVPGLTGPLDVHRAVVEVSGNHVVADPLAVEIGGSSFAGRLEHEGDPEQPWQFDIRAGKLSIEQSALWFEALGHPASLLDRIPMLSSLDTRRAAARDIFRTLNARGRLSSPAVVYQNLTLADFQATVGVSDGVISVSEARFRSGGGRGEGHFQADLSLSPARITGDVSLEGTNLQAISEQFPSPVKATRGFLSGMAHFETSGLSRQQMSSNLRAQAALKLRDVSFGDFDPLDQLAREAHCGRLEPLRKGSLIRSAALTIEARDRRIFLARTPVEIAGARIELTGSCAFDGTLDLSVHGDFSRLTRRWRKPLITIDSPGGSAGAGPALVRGSTDGTTASGSAVAPPVSGSRPGLGSIASTGGRTADAPNSCEPLLDVRLVGPLDQLTVVPTLQVSRNNGQ